MLMPGTVSADVACDQPLALDTFEQVQCCFKEGASVVRCLDGEIGRLTKEHGVKPVLKALEEASADPMVDVACHQVGHAIGRAAYLQMGFGEAFHACDGTCHFACYHGILERVFLTPEQVASGQSHAQLEDIEEKIPTLCTLETVGSDEPMLLAQCFHGLGHGLLYTLGYDLNAALNGCERLPRRMDQRWCALGAFMEATNAPDPENRKIRPEDPWYPCTEIADTWKGDCINNQTKALIQLGKTDVEIAALCMSLPNHARDCFIGLGRDMSPAVREGKTGELGAFCIAQGAHAGDCLEGAAQALMDFSRTQDDAQALCSASGDQEAACRSTADRYWKTYFDAAPEDPLGRILKYLWEMISSLWA